MRYTEANGLTEEQPEVVGMVTTWRLYPQSLLPHPWKLGLIDHGTLHCAQIWAQSPFYHTGARQPPSISCGCGPDAEGGRRGNTAGTPDHYVWLCC